MANVIQSWLLLGVLCVDFWRCFIRLVGAMFVHFLHLKRSESKNLSAPKPLIEGESKKPAKISQFTGFCFRTPRNPRPRSRVSCGTTRLTYIYGNSSHGGMLLNGDVRVTIQGCPNRDLWIHDCNIQRY